MIHYITSSANSGDGTLRNLIANASDGDIIEPSLSAFPLGTVCEITLSSNLNITKALTIRGAHTKIVVNGDNLYQVYFNNIEADIVVEDCEFVNMHGTYGSVRYNVKTIELNRVSVVGCEVANGGAGHVSTSVELLVVRNSAFYGNKATSRVGSFYIVNAETRVELLCCTFAGNLPDDNFNRPPAVQKYCKFGVSGMKVPPDVSSWTSDSWKEWDLHILSSHADSQIAFSAEDQETYGDYLKTDLQGFFRNLSSDSLGAFASINPELFWIGKDSSGNVVDSPSFSSSDGWASSPVATVSGSTLPSSVNSVYVSGEVAFSDVPTNGLVYVGDCARITFGDGTDNPVSYELAHGAYVRQSSLSYRFNPTKFYLGRNSNFYGNIIAGFANDIGQFEMKAESGSTLREIRIKGNVFAPETTYTFLRIFGADGVFETQPAGTYSTTRLFISGQGEIKIDKNARFDCSYCVIDGVDGAFTADSSPIVVRPTIDATVSNVTATDIVCFDLSNASSAVTLSFSSRQEVRNNLNGATLTGWALVNNEEVLNNWTISQGSTLELVNCMVRITDISGFNLIVRGGSYRGSSLSINANTSTEATTPTYQVSFTDCSLNLSSLIVKDCWLKVSGSSFVFSDWVFSVAKLTLDQIDNGSTTINSFAGNVDLEIANSTLNILTINVSNLTLNNATLTSNAITCSVKASVLNSTIQSQKLTSGTLESSGGFFSVKTTSVNQIRFDNSSSLNSLGSESNSLTTLNCSLDNTSQIAASTLKVNTSGSITLDHGSSFIMSNATVDNSSSITIRGASSFKVQSSSDSVTSTLNGTILLDGGELSLNKSTVNSVISTGSDSVARTLEIVNSTVNSALDVDANNFILQGSTFKEAVALADYQVNSTWGNTRIENNCVFEKGLTCNCQNVTLSCIGQATVQCGSITLNDSSLTNSTLTASANCSIATSSISFTNGLEINASALNITNESVAVTGDGLLKLRFTTFNASGNSVDIGTEQSPVQLDLSTSSDVSFDELYLDDFTITSANLTANVLKGDGEIVAELVDIDSIVSSDLNIQADVQTSQLISSKLILEGDLTTSTLSSNNATLQGNLIAETATVMGTLRGNQATLGQTTIKGTFEYTTSSVESLTILDSLTATGDLSIGTLDTTGSFNFNCGTFKVDTITLTGTATGEIEATEIKPMKEISIGESASLTLPGLFTVDEINSAGSFYIQGVPDSLVIIKNNYSIKSLENSKSDTVYVSIPFYPEDDIDLIGLFELQVQNGTARDFLASADGNNTVVFTWKDNAGIPVRIEKFNGETYDLLTKNAQAVYSDGEYVGSVSMAIPNVNGTQFRLFDGVKYLYDVAYTVVNPAFYKYTVGTVYSPGESLNRNENLLALALIEDSVSGDLLSPSDVSSVSATLYKRVQTNVGVYDRKPEPGWNKVDIDPRCVVEESSCSLMDSFNFCWVPDQSILPLIKSKGSYEIQFRISLTENRNPAVVTFKFDCE